MRRLLPALAIPLLLVLPSLAYPGDVRMGDDWGGKVDHYTPWRDRMDRSEGTRFVFDGLCASSCTILAFSPNACVEPAASLGFHAFTRKGEVDLPMTGALARRYYPRVVYHLIQQLELQGELGEEIKWVGYDQIVHSGIMRPCDPDGEDD